MKKAIWIAVVTMALVVGLASTSEKTKAYVLPEYVQPMSEMRGAWVATVGNIDISKQVGLTDASIVAWKNQYTSILNNLEALNMNAVFFQVRPTNDAFYESDLNPWSAYMVSHGTHPGWDPMAWMIEETHKRGMEFHAWLNPYRVSPSNLLANFASTYTSTELTSIKQNYLQSLSSKSFARRNQTLVVFGERETKLYLNPARAEVVSFIKNTVVEIMDRYDIDGIHFDDYFYPTRSLTIVDGMTGISVQKDVEDYDFARRSTEEQALYPNTSAGRANWRRSNVDKMVKSVSDAVRDFNQTSGRSRIVRFGISPAAVWAPSSAQCPGDSRAQPGGMDVPCGSYSSYLDLYADTRKWVLNEWVDYIVPQAYYTLASTYTETASWWSAQARGKNVNVYMGMGLYRYGDSGNPFTDTMEMANQLRYNQNYPEIKGVLIFSYRSLISNHSLMRTAVARMKELWTRPTFNASYEADSTPADEVPPLGGLKFTDRAYLSFSEVDDVLGYILFRFESSQTPDFSDESKIVNLFRQVDGSAYRKTIDQIPNIENYTYYLKSFGKNATLSEMETWIAYTDLGTNTAPVVETLQVGDKTDFAKGETITITASASDIDGQDLTFILQFAEDGEDFRYSYPVVAVDNQISFAWEAFHLTLPNAKFRLVVSDGDLTTERISHPFSIGIEKASVPIGVQLTPSSESITVMNPMTEWEYSLDGSTWTSETVFTGLETSTNYTIHVRVKASATNLASDPALFTVKTLKPMGVLPEQFQFTPTYYSIAVTSPSNTVYTGLEYSLDGVNWSSNNVFYGLSSNTDYTIRIRTRETLTHLASASVLHSVKTLKPDSTAPTSLRVIVKGNTITITPQANSEYSMDGIDWTTDPIFTDLEYKTEYKVYIRRMETNELNASKAYSVQVVTKANPTVGIVIGTSASVTTIGAGLVVFLLKRKRLGI